MAEFKKYNSIENSYRDKYISKFLNMRPELQEIVYIAREKIDGANIQLLFTPNEPMKVGKRTCFLSEDDKFYDIWNTLGRYEVALAKFQRYADERNSELLLFGEIAGPGVNGRVNYGETKTIWIFDAYENTFLMSQIELDEFFLDNDLQHLQPPTIGIYDNLVEALKIDVEFDSKILNKKDNCTEGVVIQPLQEVIRTPNGERFILKKKGKRFSEEVKKKHTKIKHVDPIVTDLNLAFRGYVNKNRVISVFSKHGEIEKPQQIGEYIKLVLDDAKEDFLKDNSVEGLDKNQTQGIFNVGSTIVYLLKEYL